MIIYQQQKSEASAISSAIALSYFDKDLCNQTKRDAAKQGIFSQTQIDEIQPKIVKAKNEGKTVKAILSTLTESSISSIRILEWHLKTNRLLTFFLVLLGIMLLKYDKIFA